MMATKRKKPEDINGNSETFVAGHDNNFFRFEGFQHDDKVALVSVHLEMMQKYLNFCKEKVSSERTSFMEKLSTDFGDHLSCDVVDELCKLVVEKKCMLVESIVLNVLQILRDASKKVNTVPAHKKSPNTKVINGNHDLSDKDHCHSKEEINNGIGAPIVDTPTFLPVRDFSADSYVQSQQVPPVPQKPKSKPNQFIGKLHAHVAPSLQVPIENPIKDVQTEAHVLMERKSKVKDLGKLADQMYNRRNVSLVMSKNNCTTTIDPADRFHVSEIDMCYYKVLCGLAHSQWKNHEGVMLHKTTVTYKSLGESIEPLGHVDNFFIAGYCRKLFDDSHPKKSKKHYFYPHIAGCLLSYSSIYDFNTLSKSFLGANSALRLHEADKLCFPIFHNDIKHWSVFIVDMRLKRFVFLDSMFGENDLIQINTRRVIIPAFKRCFNEYAEVKSDLDFRPYYPPVPKQNNVHDCGIFAIMFMELWDSSVDLRCVFGHSDIPRIRVKTGLSLFFSRENGVDKTLVQHFFENGINPHGIFDQHIESKSTVFCWPLN